MDPANEFRENLRVVIRVVLHRNTEIASPDESSITVLL
jgi:hypothetical protein